MLKLIRGGHSFLWRFAPPRLRRAQHTDAAVRREPAAARSGAAPRVAASADEAVSRVASGASVFVHSVAHAPTELLEALARRRDVSGVSLSHIHIEGTAPHMAAAASAGGRFRTRNLFVGQNARAAVAEGRADFVPVFLSEIPSLFRRGALPVDVALLTVSPPDAHGFCTLGASVDIARAAAQCAATLVAVVSRKVPRTFGDSLVHFSQLDVVLERDVALHAAAPRAATEAEDEIGRLVAHELVRDGATLQLGIGGIANSVLRHLAGHRDLGIYSEMVSDGIVDLVTSGVVTGAHKLAHPGRVTAGFAFGSSKLYCFLDNNPGVVMKDIAFVNDVARIGAQPGMVSVNGALEVDLSGQVCADSLGHEIFSGVGGAVDFNAGASLSRGGVAVTVLPSQTRGGRSRLVSALAPGAGVVTTRAHVRHVATEFGIAALHGRSLGERARALIAIAHPSARDELTAAARKQRLL